MRVAESTSGTSGGFGQPTWIVREQWSSARNRAIGDLDLALVQNLIPRDDRLAFDSRASFNT
jgi:hypothetical protein